MVARMNEKKVATQMTWTTDYTGAIRSYDNTPEEYDTHNSFHDLADAHAGLHGRGRAPDTLRTPPCVPILPEGQGLLLVEPSVVGRPADMVPGPGGLDRAGEGGRDGSVRRRRRDGDLGAQGQPFFPACDPRAALDRGRRAVPLAKASRLRGLRPDGGRFVFGARPLGGRLSA